jgi:sporulation protein YlmC with PRC-barrel domain
LKRLSVLPLMVIAALLLTSCIGTAQATINPNPTAVSTAVVSSGTGSVTSVPSTGSTESSGQAGGVSDTSVPSTGFSDTSVPGTGLSGTSVPNTGSTSPLGTYVPETPGVGLEGTTMPTYGPGDITNATNTANYGIPETGATAQGPEGTSYPGGYGPEDMATSQALLPPGSGTGQSSGVTTGTSVPSTGVTGTQVPNTGGQTTTNNQLVRLQSLQNYPLMGTNGASQGQVADFVINLLTSRVDYLVVTTNGRQVLVPWAGLSLGSSSSQSFAFPYDAAQLQNAPSLNQGGIDFNQQNWSSNVQNYWSSGVNAGAQSGTSTPGSGSVGSGTYAALFSQLQNVQVTTSVPPNSVVNTPQAGNNFALGTIRDAVVNPSTGDVPYLLVAPNTDFLGLNNRLIPVPFNAFQRTTNGSTLSFNIDVNSLRNAPSFDANNLPNNLGMGWDSSILSYWVGGLFRSSTAVPQTTNP